MILREQDIMEKWKQRMVRQKALGGIDISSSGARKGKRAGSGNALYADGSGSDNFDMVEITDDDVEKD